MIIETDLARILHRGKVRDTYLINDHQLLMSLPTGISAFDVVLPNGIPDKGLVLNRMSAFWFDRTRHLGPNHFIALADGAEAAPLISTNDSLSPLPPAVAKQAMVVKRAERIDIECIVRGYITGSAWAEYQRHGQYREADARGTLGRPSFPRASVHSDYKAEEGHDQNMTDQEVIDMVGSDLAQQLADQSTVVYQYACGYALERDIILADTKWSSVSSMASLSSSTSY